MTSEQAPELDETQAFAGRPKLVSACARAGRRRVHEITRKRNARAPAGQRFTCRPSSSRVSPRAFLGAREFGFER